MMPLLQISCARPASHPLLLMFRERGRSTATSRHSLPNLMPSFCRPVARWVQPTPTSLKRCANHQQRSRAVCTRLTTTTSRVLDHVRLTGSKQWPVLFIPTPSNEPGHAPQDIDFVCAAWRSAAARHHLDVFTRE